MTSRKVPVGDQDWATELEGSSVSIICLTRENLDSTWIHFEAGALSKQQQNTYVCTLLLGLEPTDVREPLAQFQATKVQKDDLQKLVFTINGTLGDSRLPESELSEAFEVWWPKLEERLADIGDVANAESPVRNDRELLEEILELVRTQANLNRFVPGIAGLKKEVTLADLSPEDARLISESMPMKPEDLDAMSWEPNLLFSILYSSKAMKIIREEGYRNKNKEDLK